MKKVLALMFSVLFFTTSAFAAKAVRVEPLQMQLSLKSVKAVEAAIMQGCVDRGWVPAKMSDNKIQATLNVRVHQLTVDINYSEKGYTIEYVSSKNMQYNQKRKTIHPKYNNWIANLNKSIQNNIDFTK